MISAWWLLPAAMFGAVIGFFAYALCAMAAKEDANRQGRDRRLKAVLLPPFPRL